MARIFISYKRTDKEKVFKIKDLIESAPGEKGYADAQYYLAHCYENSFGLEGDYAVAEKCYIKADEKGNLFAKVRLIELKSVKANL